MQWRCLNRTLDLRRTVVMGILNVTPDSFTDGGRYVAADAALARVATMVAEGALIVDVGGESTRPGAEAVPVAAEIERVVPIVERIRARFDVAISIDTSKPEVMAAALAAGAAIVNDVRALRADGALALVARSGAGVCLMHMQGEPRTMQQSPQYGDVVADVGGFLAQRRADCIAAGIAPEAIVLDPGIGFGKTESHNLTLLRRLPELLAPGAPLLIGVSRKSFIGRILGRDVEGRVNGGLGIAALAAGLGARIIRTHDVAATVEAVRMVDAVMLGA
jgi:dihydropteroate synthase